MRTFEKQLKQQLDKAATKVARSTKRHFKKDGWNLDYGFLVSDVFYEAFGHHLETYLLKRLQVFGPKAKLYLKTDSVESRVVVAKRLSTRVAHGRPKARATKDKRGRR